MPFAHRGIARFKSCPSRGTWIEIPLGLGFVLPFLCRAPRGARGLKFSILRAYTMTHTGRAPRGARGLKFDSLCKANGTTVVVPLAGHVD